MNNTRLFIPDSTLSAGSFHSPASLGTTCKMIPYYGKHFTQPPSLQPRLFLGCNHLCLIFKVLPILGFCFTTDVRILASHSYALIRSYSEQNFCYIKIWCQNCKPMTTDLSRSFSSRHSLPWGNRVLGFPLAS